MDEPVALTLSHAEALVLLNLLDRFDPDRPLSIEDEAERIVLWRIEGQLEKTIVEQFAPNYGELIAEARARVRNSE